MCAAVEVRDVVRESLYVGSDGTLMHRGSVLAVEMEASVESLLRSGFEGISILRLKALDVLHLEDSFTEVPIDVTLADEEFCILAKVRFRDVSMVWITPTRFFIGKNVLVNPLAYFAANPGARSRVRVRFHLAEGFFQASLDQVVVYPA